MANLRANKITSTEVFETTGSVQFTGTTSALAVPAGTDFAYGTGTFTIECFIYAPTLAATPGASYADHHIFSQTVGGTNYLMLSYDPNGTLYWTNATSGGGTVVTTSSGVVVANKWQHIVASRDSNNILRMFVDGSVVYSGYNNFDFNDTTRNPTIGNYTHIYSQLPFTGHISNLRILKGTALYTKNFTPPTRELTVIPNTVLLACTSTTNTAQEATGKTITVNGNAVANELTPGLLTDRVKSGGTSAITGSVEFGESDYLSLASSSDFNLGTGDFTIEFWIHPQKRFTPYPTIFQINATNAANVLVINFRNTSTLGLTNGNTVFATNTGFNLDSWFHVAIVRQSGVSKIYKNGISGGDTACTEDFSNSGSSNISIGWDSTIVSSEKYNGFISNLRVLKGTALYTGSFIPPSRELKKIPNTVLLCCKNSNDPTAEETGKTITANGDPAASNFTPQIGSDGSVTFDGVTKINTQNYFYLPTGNTENRGRGRGVFGGGGITNANVIEYIQIQSTGTAIDFGDLSANKLAAAACSSSTRGVFGCGYIQPSQNDSTNVIEFITISSTGNAVDFGDLSGVNHSRRFLSSCSSSTRGVFAGGVSSQPANNTIVNSISYVTIASIGDAIDFGDLTGARASFAACSSSTRGVFGGGSNPTALNKIEYITIQSTGDATDFGDLSGVRASVSACSSSTRGIFAGGYSSFPSSVNTIEFITIASTGDTTDFGDLSGVRRDFASSSSSTRAVFGGGYTPPSVLYNILELITISSTGNAQDFGDLNDAKYSPSACSDSHGGLS